MCSSRSLWGTVCNRQWTEANSRVVCRSLGYSDKEGRVAPHYSYLFCYLIAPISFGDGGWLGCLQGKILFHV